MAARFLAPDLTLLAPAALIEEVDFEEILDAQKQWILDRWDDVRKSRPDLPPIDTLGLETEPMTIVVESYAYRETLIRAVINDKARAVMLAYSTGTDLDHLGVRFGVVRATIVAADDVLGTAAIMESDDRLRRRIQLAPEAFSTAGARGAYIFHALGADTSIYDAWAYSPKEGRVEVVVAGADGADLPASVLAALIERFAEDDVTPLTDAVTVRRAVRHNYAVSGTLYVQPGPDPAIIKAAAEEAITAYATEREKISTAVYRSGLIAAGQSGGPDSFVLAAPTADVLVEDYEIPHLTAINLTTSILSS